MTKPTANTKKKEKKVNKVKAANEFGRKKFCSYVSIQEWVNKPLNRARHAQFAKENINSRNGKHMYAK